MQVFCKWASPVCSYSRCVKRNIVLRGWWITFAARRETLTSWWDSVCHVVCVFTWCVQACQFALVLSLFPAPGCLHAVHQHCGPLSGRYELQSSSAVRVHQTGPGWLPGGKAMNLLNMSVWYRVFNADRRSTSEIQTHGERQAFGADPGLPGQRVWRGWSAGRCRDEERSPGKGGGTGGSPVPRKCTTHSGPPGLFVCLWDQFMRVLWFLIHVRSATVSMWWLEIQQVFAFRVRFRIMTGCRAMESTARGTILILFSCWHPASASHGALQKTSFTWKRS